VSTRIPIKYSSAWSWLLILCCVPQRSAYIEIDGLGVEVHMGYAFRAAFTRADVGSVTANSSVVSVGVHGWNGRWLVNGANSPIARITFSTPVPARVLGLPIRLRELLVSVDDVAELRRALLT
jgi:hypothetical protein